MNYLNKIKKIVSVVLAVAIMVVTSFGELGDVKQCFAATVKTIECDGVKYQITYKVSGKNYDITTQNLRTKETANLFLNTATKKGTITQTTYTSTGKAVVNKTSYDGNAITPSKSSGISYDGKVEIDMSKHYYYQNGTNGKKTYLKIGRKSDSYRIRTDNLNSAKKKNCKEYQNYVIDGQYNVNKGYAYCAAASVPSTLVIGICIANIMFPVATIVEIVLLVVGGGGIVSLITQAVISFVSAYKKQQKAANVYNTIKTYGTKL